MFGPPYSLDDTLFLNSSFSLIATHVELGNRRLFMGLRHFDAARVREQSLKESIAMCRLSSLMLSVSQETDCFFKWILIGLKSDNEVRLRLAGERGTVRVNGIRAARARGVSVRCMRIPPPAAR